MRLPFQCHSRERQLLGKQCGSLGASTPCQARNRVPALAKAAPPLLW
jgi:hypothetical protein